eukprot:gnl/MRDRNA2_/MRDRNA2_214531_c0_seq1.p1 gnl/MRDRNA2_/MRDRNA2_214531_c0~~gnl/MRDRNA2_/MRDRNA2_214531_c0_seq1.p1  ORF type:complete len:157 (+),score=32.47 gnl/MRDRNA2_/MRDRNA2_214531_c0_seq1:47-472(+)
MGHHEQHNMLTSERAARVLRTYLTPSIANQTTVAIISETSAADPELMPLHDLGFLFPGLRMQFFLGEEEMVLQAAQERAARDLFIMGTSTTLLMCRSYFSLLGAFLQEPNAVRFMEELDDQFHIPAKLRNQWGWHSNYIPN